MTRYNVHIYREMRLLFVAIDADSREAAAALAAERATAEADDVQDCDGDNLAALVDVEGDEDYAQSLAIDFEAERQRKAGPQLLAALLLVRRALNTAPRFRVGDSDSYAIAARVDKTITLAEAAGIVAAAAAATAEAQPWTR